MQKLQNVKKSIKKFTFELKVSLLVAEESLRSMHTHYIHLNKI